jgi:short-subunit dehydrogenase
VDALVVNAGVAVAGPFVGESTLEEQLNVVDLNVRSAVHLAKLLVPDMVARGSGRVLFTSSIAAVMPGPFQTVYNASKAFLLSFSQALREELKDSGVTVTALMPGPTDTEFFDRADMGDTKLGASEHKDDPAVVAKQGYEAMMAGKDHVVAGSFKNKAQVAAAKVLPDTALAAQHRKMSEPGSADS